MKIGNVELMGNVFLAPMAGVTDLPFRCMCKKYGCGFVYSEMVSAKGLFFKDKKTDTLMKLDEAEKPAAIQIFGSDPDIIAKIVESSGAAAITIHGRTREQFYTGKADREIIKKTVEAVSIPVIGNGDIFSPEDAVEMMETTGCAGVMVARGAQGNPFIFRQIDELIKTGSVSFYPTPAQRVECAVELFNRLIEEKGERRGVKEARKHIAWFVKGLKGSAELKNKIFSLTDANGVICALNDYINVL